jgi:acyl carrier protein
MNGDAASSIARDVETFIRERFAVPATDARFGRDVDLWDMGYVDSLGVVELVAFIETRFNTKLPVSVLFHPEFKTIDGIGRLTAKHLEGAPSTAQAPAGLAFTRV